LSRRLMPDHRNIKSSKALILGVLATLLAIEPQIFAVMHNVARGISRFCLVLESDRLAARSE
jgi:hypothetical protein